VLQADIQANLLTAFPGRGELGSSPDQLRDAAVFSAYTGCFRTMAVLTVLMLPGILLFRVLRPGRDDAP
jgi:hypothetical protein